MVPKKTRPRTRGGGRRVTTNHESEPYGMSRFMTVKCLHGWRRHVHTERFLKRLCDGVEQNG